MDYNTNVKNHAQTFEPLQVLALQQHYVNTHKARDPTPTLPIAASPIPTTAAPTSPPYREWEDLTTLTIPAITALLHDLSMRCLSTRVALDVALTTLETSTQFFLSADPPMSSSSVTAYYNAYTCARLAGSALFAPQNAYRSVVTTLGMLVADLLDLLPENGDFAADVTARFRKGVRETEEKEEAVRRHMRGLADGRSRGQEGLAIVVYLDTARQRFGNLKGEEGRLVRWAGECVRVLRRW